MDRRFRRAVQISHRLAFRDMGPSPQDKQIRNIETCRCRPVQSGNGDTERIAARQERDIPPPRDAGKILEASAVLAGCRVPQVTYDLMLRHPFETEEDIRQTFELCTELRRPFELQLHGLYFLPGTDIIKIAEKHGMPVPIPGSGPDGSIKTAFRAYWGKRAATPR